MKFALLTIGVLAVAMSANAEPVKIRIVHHNIKELDSTKLESPNSQVIAAAQILKELKGDILSINELQYDLPGVPTSEFQTTGQNLDRFRELFAKSMNSIFFPANTGMLAKRMANGDYTTNTKHPDWKELADHANFGLLPAQYSTGAVSRYPVIETRVFADLKWREFDPSFDPSAFKDAIGRPYSRELELFDKNFTDATIDIDGRKVHLILLHTVPAFNFGNPQGLNEQRNSAQLRFLKYYLTGKITENDRPVVLHLPANSTFIALGDWNVDRDISPLQGAKILKELGTEFQYWTPERVITYESQNFSQSPFASQLDYILLSRDFRIESSGIYRDDRRIEKGCTQKPTDKAPSGYSLEKYLGKMGEVCWVFVPEKMALAKRASDHFAIFAEVALP